MKKLDGRPSGATKGEWKTTNACPYPLGFCEHLAPLIVAPYRDTFCTARVPDASEAKRSSSARVLANYNWTAADVPLDSHYLTHLPKHKGCKACNHCKVQRKQCRDKTKRPALLKPPVLKEPSDVPKKFGDLITSDHILALNERSKSRYGDTTALTCKDRATKWLDGVSCRRKIDDGHY